MRITGIETTKKGRYALMVEDEFVFSLHRDTFLTTPWLQKDAEVTEEQLEELRREDELRSARESALDYLSAAEQTSGMLRQKLQRWYGKEAVEAFVNNPADTFDLILMDIMMPVMNGYDATRAIRSIGNRADASTIPIIAVTANAFAEDAQNAMDAGMDAHLAKPLVMDEVTKTIAGKVRKKRKNHEDH